MHPFTVLADPVRRRIVEVLADRERSAGEVVQVVGGEFGISQSAVSQQLRVLRDHGFARVRPEGARRVYTLEPAAVDAVDRWLEGVRGFWSDRLEDLAVELEGRPPTPSSTRTPTAAGAAAGPGHIDQITRTVRDLAESAVFYGTLLRLPHLGTSGQRAVFAAGGTRLVLSRRDPPAADESVITFQVPDLPLATERLRAAGVAVRRPPQLAGGEPDGEEAPTVWFEDPEGRPLAIVQRRAPGG